MTIRHGYKLVARARFERTVASVDDFANLMNLPAHDPYRRALDGDYFPKDTDVEEWAAVRATVLRLLDTDAGHTSTTPTARQPRRGRITQFVLWCHREGYSLEPGSLLRPARIEQYMAVRGEAATSAAAIDSLRYVLHGVADGHGVNGSASVKAPRPSGRVVVPVPLSDARRLLRIADSLPSTQSRVDSRAILALVHGVGLQSHEVVDFDSRRVVTDADGAVFVADSDGELRAVLEPYGAVLMTLAQGADALVLRRSKVVSRRLQMLREEASRSGYDMTIDVPSLRAGHRAAAKARTGTTHRP